LKYYINFFYLLLSLGTYEHAKSYPTFIGYGYTSCQVCHFNAFGNGPLTDYGRALGATMISARGPFAGKQTEEGLALASGFLGSRPLPEWFRPALDFRGLSLIDEMQLKGSRKRLIPMQLDAAITLQNSSRNHWATMSVGYLPKRGIEAPSSEGRLPLISREHYVSTLVTESLRVNIGMMDIVYGIRTPDHTAYSRAASNLRQNDQAHQFLVHHFGETYEVGVAAILGNLFQDSELRQKGGSLLAEYDLYEKIRIGHSHAYTSNNYRSRLMNAVHARIGAGEGSAVLFEVGMVSEKTKIPSQTFSSYLLTENMVRVMRGLHILVLGEYFTRDTFNPNTRFVRLGPAIQYFPMNRIELRGDFQVTRGLNAPSVEKDSLDLLIQAHVWF
jgi:hypothetical protein